MKVILLQDIAKLGRRYDVVEVPNGHALNKLIPTALAKPASKENLKQVEAMKQKGEAVAAAVDETFKSALETLDGKEVAVRKEANENGHLYEAVKESHLVSAFEAEGAKVLESQVHIKEPIKEVGSYEVELHSGDSRGTVTVVVIAAS